MFTKVTGKDNFGYGHQGEGAQRDKMSEENAGDKMSGENAGGRKNNAASFLCIQQWKCILLVGK